MQAEITYNGGKSYRVKNHIFKLGQTVIVDDAEVIGLLMNTTGFAIRVTKEKDASPKPMIAAKKIVEVDEESQDTVEEVRPKKIIKR